MLPDFRDMIAEQLVAVGMQWVTFYRAGSCGIDGMNCLEDDSGDEEGEARVSEYYIALM